jgi:ACR3 family arsenite efflux pump ArsB
MTQNKLAPLRPLFILFVLLSGFFVTGKTLLDRWDVDRDVLIIGNILLLIVTLVSYLMLYRGLHAANPHSFVRAMYGSFIIKFFIIALSAFIYILVAKNDVNKPALIACMFLYLVYTFLEVSVLTKLLKQKKNA